ncbi:MAG: CoA pyrophosphatase [Myxococcota bacterium]|nr:CoA pyrophosphatase [Myxococcota bacterium]
MNPGQRYAAVALVIDFEMRILMIQRPKKPRDPWSGHMAFPGGKVEEQDADLKATAERECEEEVGISLPAQGEFLGALSVLQHPKLSIGAFVYYLPEQPDLNCNEEVEEYFWISLQELASTQRTFISHSFNQTKRRFPAIPLLDVPIWGISLNFLDQLLTRMES